MFHKLHIGIAELDPVSWIGVTLHASLEIVLDEFPKVLDAFASQGLRVFQTIGNLAVCAFMPVTEIIIAAKLRIKQRQYLISPT
jgi:hypothetical protein